MLNEIVLHGRTRYVLLFFSSFEFTPISRNESLIFGRGGLDIIFPLADVVRRSTLLLLLVSWLLCLDINFISECNLS